MSYVYDIISVNIPRYLSISDTRCFRAQTGQYLGWLVRARSAADTELVDGFSGRTANIRRQTAPEVKEVGRNHQLVPKGVGQWPAPDSCSTQSVWASSEVDPFNFPVVTLANVFTTSHTVYPLGERGKALEAADMLRPKRNSKQLTFYNYSIQLL